MTGSQHDTSTSLITSPRAFEQTLQSQEIDGNASSCRMQEPALRQQQPRPQQTTKGIRNPSNEDVTSYQAHNNNCHNSHKMAPVIEQPISIQLIQSMNPAQQQQQQSNIGPHFNYNPLYTGVQSFNDGNPQQNQINRSVNDSDKIFDEMNHQLQGVAEDLLNEAEYVLKDICNYTDANDNSHKHTNNQFNQSNGAQRVQSNMSIYGSQQSSIARSSRPPFNEQVIVRTSNQFVDQNPANQFGDTLNNSANLAVPQSMMDGQNQFQSQRTTRRKITQDQRLLNQHQNIDPHQFVSNNNHLSMQNSGNFQQQFSLSTNQIDLSEDCQGLFVEYQNNRNSMGGLEELHSLNVTNCDSDALEEHINMTSSDDCFTNHDDLSDFGMGSGDNLLNMLFGGNNQVVNSTNSIMSGNTNQAVANQPHHQSNVNVTQFEAVDCDDASGSSGAKATSSHMKSSSNKTITQKKTIKKNPNQLASANKTNSKKPTASTSCSSKKKDQSTQNNRPIEGNSQNKITTMNTNKRLLPKKCSQPSSQTSKSATQSKVPSASNSWMASPSSTSITSNTSGTLSPSSNSQFEYEDPYRHQLDNLRKKLKMDVIPIPSDDLPITSQQTNLSHPQFQNTNTLITQASDGPNTITISRAPVISSNTTIGNGHGTNNGNNVTYVIARPVDSQKFDQNASLFLRTPNGLLPLSRTDRGISIPMSAIGDQQRLEFSSTTNALSNSIVLSCVGGSSALSNQGPMTNQIFQADGQQQRKSIVTNISAANITQPNAEPSQVSFSNDRESQIIDTDSAQNQHQLIRRFNSVDQSNDINRTKLVPSHDHLLENNLNDYIALEGSNTNQQVQSIITNLQSV